MSPPYRPVPTGGGPLRGPAGKARTSVGKSWWRNTALSVRMVRSDTRATPISDPILLRCRRTTCRTICCSLRAVIPGRRTCTVTLTRILNPLSHGGPGACNGRERLGGELVLGGGDFGGRLARDGLDAVRGCVA